MLIHQSIEKFLEAIASSDPVPGGGSVAAQSGATSAALVEMVANLTVGRKNYEAVEAEMIAVSKRAVVLRNELVADIDLDAEAFTGVMAAYKLPKVTDVEKQTRNEQIQIALKYAALIPLGVARKSMEIIQLSKIVVASGNKNAVTDGLVSAMMARTSVLSAIYNVKINLASITDDAYIEQLRQEIEEIVHQATHIEREIIAFAKV